MSLRKGTSWGLDSASDDIDWRVRGACASDEWDPNLWTSHSADDHGQAAWICQRLCDVRTKCMAWARDNPREVRNGVYGGYWWTSRHASAPARPHNVAARTPTGSPAVGTGDPAGVNRPVTDEERIAWMWAARVPLTDIAERVGCSRQDVARRVGELQQTAGQGRPDTDACGTPKGYKRHLRRDEAACARCLAANAAAKADRARGAA